MMKKNMKTMLAATTTLILSLACLTGCSHSSELAAKQETEQNIALASGGVLCLSVNPEIAINYDEKGLVTGVTARNDDALKILSDYAGFQGKECRVVVKELVTEIGEAGYFVEEVDGEKRQITIEIEKGSRLPDDRFLDEVIEEVRDCVNANKWAAPLAVEGTTDYGMTNYIDTDYGPENDGVTDYIDTDYGPNNDGVTDYDDTDYGPNNDGVTDYDDTDYGPNNDGVTDYDDTDYGPNNDGVTDYDNGNSDYDDGNSDYDDGSSNYGGDSGYDD